MRKAIITTCLIGSGLIILGQFNAFESLVIFLIAGVVPGTNYAIPYQAMLLITMSIAMFIIFRITANETTVKSLRTRMEKPIRRKKQLPKRRYSEI